MRFAASLSYLSHARCPPHRCLFYRRAAAGARGYSRTDRRPRGQHHRADRELAGSGWQFEGFWGGFRGTPIAPHFFLSAKHIGNAGGSVFTFGALNYSVVRGFADPNSDLDLWQVTETFPTFAPLYTQADEAGKLTVVIGRGTQRGSDHLVNGNLAGWNWGPGDGVRRRGTNVISEIVALGPDDELLRGPFDAGGLAEEAHLSSGDSGGAAFIEDGGVWKLAGTHYTVDGPFYLDASGSGGFNAALFDTRGLYVSDEGNPRFTLWSPATRLFRADFIRRASPRNSPGFTASRTR